MNEIRDINDLKEYVIRFKTTSGLRGAGMIKDIHWHLSQDGLSILLDIETRDGYELTIRAEDVKGEPIFDAEK